MLGNKKVNVKIVVKVEGINYLKQNCKKGRKVTSSKKMQEFFCKNNIKCRQNTLFLLIQEKEIVNLNYHLKTKWFNHIWYYGHFLT